MYPLLDSMFGFFVWLGHFLAIYAVTALACVTGFASTDGGGRTTVLAGVIVFTLLAGAVVALHGLRRYRQQRERPRSGFRMRATIGLDALAVVAIVWQIFPVLLVPICV